MLEQAPLPNEKPSLPLQLQADRDVAAEEVAPRSRSRLLWMGFGFAVVMLIGGSACALLPLDSHASAKLAHQAPMVAFIPSLPGFAPGGIRLAMVSKDQKIKQQGLRRNLGKISGSLQRSSAMVGSVLDGPTVGSTVGFSNSVLLNPKPTYRQYAPPPAPPPPSPPTPPPGGGGGGPGGRKGPYLRRYTGSEAAAVLDRWIDRVNVYCLTDQFDDPAGLAPVHRATLQQLKSFRSFIDVRRPTVTRQGFVEEKVLYGLYSLDNDEMPLVVAGGYSHVDGITSVDPKGTFELKYISVNPKDLRKPTTFGIPAMTEALDRLARHESRTLVIDKDKYYGSHYYGSTYYDTGIDS